MDLALGLSRADAEHEARCPEIGPICAVRAEPPQQHHSTLWLSELRLLAEYGLFRRLALQAVLPLRWVDTRTRYSDLNGNFKTLDYPNIHHLDGTLFGVGDGQLLAHSGLTLGAVQLSGRVGVSFPFGQVTENPYRLGAQGLPHQHAQFGTGSFDPLLGVDASWHRAKLTLSGFGFVRAPLYAGRNGYQAGTQLSGGAVLSMPAGATTAAGLRVSLLVTHEFAERWDGVVPSEDGNLGRTDLFAGFGLTVPFGGDWSASFDLNARVWGQTAGAQLDLPVVLQLSVGRLFHFESASHEEFAAGAPHGDVRDVVTQGEAAPLLAEPGKWTVFDFWAPWCEACVGLDARLRTLAAERPELAIRRVNIVDFETPIARQELPGVSVLPHLRLVSPEGKIALEQSGPADALFDALLGKIEAPSYSCPMHPQIVRSEPGLCPICGMKLERRR